jgi:hypothetical protein
MTKRTGPLRLAAQPLRLAALSLRLAALSPGPGQAAVPARLRSRAQR